MKKTPLSIRISDVMKKQGMTQQNLALTLEVSQPAISSYLRGRMPPADILYKIARIGQTTIEWLLMGDSFSQATRVEEKVAPYGNQQLLLGLWAELPPPVQNNLLMLMRQLAAKSSL